MFDLHPLQILAVGVACVLGLIIVLRLNAFLALIISAIVVSLLSPSVPMSEKISKVATAFGGTAGNIAIVIALAAVIGKCMMDSGAADRVVRAFLSLLGEKRAPTALMGSGFVLAVPVFFDTVFYLLVPLARSLFRRTGRNYLRYILAIAAGGAITHTLVPPTPGPLAMAANLGVDVGVMILVGGSVAVFAAMAGLLFARIADYFMPIPMRPLAGGEPEPEPIDDAHLPPLFLALLPVVLPVVLISTNSVLSTLADNEDVTRIESGDVSDKLVEQLATADDTKPGPARRVRQLLPQELKDELANAAKTKDYAAVQPVVVKALNEDVLPQRYFYQAADDDFDDVLVPAAKIKKRRQAAVGRLEKLKADQERLGLKDDDKFQAQVARLQLEVDRFDNLIAINKLLGEDRGRMSLVNIRRLNRLLLETAFPGEIQPHEWETPLRRAVTYSELFGNPNFALLLSTIVAMLMLYFQRKPTLTELGRMVEVALMSGGVIILITAAGGAFGAMLKAAKIGDSIQALFGGEAAGMMLLFLGFGVAALLKVAQGSSTVAMITGSSMLAAMITDPTQLGYHPVFLATAIGSGSLIGSWMNDSGFWIFAKMGGLTEVEALKSWTILLVLLGVVGMAVTVLLASLLPPF